MESLGAGPAKQMKASEVCTMWEQGFTGIDHVHHQSGNFIVDFKSDIEAHVFCYAIAIHHKEAATKGTREFVGSYDLQAELTDLGWRLSSFKYNVKFVSGNKDLV
jgi:hypothetical protein